MRIIEKTYIYLFHQVILFGLISVLVMSYSVDSQTISNSKPLDTLTKKNVINGIFKLLTDNYVYPEKVDAIVKSINARLDDREYDLVNDPIEFGEKLTNDLQVISKDKHLRVNYDPIVASSIKNRLNNANENDDINDEEMMKADNYGFRKIEILNGNIGYIDLRSFAPSKFSRKTVATVMAFLENTNAIILDLRENGGGNPDGVQLICSYFFDTRPVHLNDIYYRPQNKKEEYWTLPEIIGDRMPEMDLYVLTSKYTFSAAEEFAYDLKNLKRATIIGEKTAGGGHSGDIMAINDDFVIFLPTGKAINPITKTNWEGVGVTPDFKTTSDRALETAQIKALEKMSNRLQDSLKRKTIEWQIGVLKAVLKPVFVKDSTLMSYAGNYSDRIIIYSKKKIYYQRVGKPTLLMIPITRDTFGFKELESFRIKFEKDSNGSIIGLTGLYSDGHTDSSRKIR